MRIIAGELGGRLFDAPRGHRTHPMGDKIRGALFNTLGDITGLTVLDAFAGSGAVSFEAVSRGAASAIAVESDKVAYTTIQRNIESLGVEEKVQLVRAFVISYVRRIHDEFDIVVADPPYDDVQYKALEILPKYVKLGGVIIYSLPPSGRLIMPENFELVSQKSYGDATLHFYRRIS